MCAVFRPDTAQPIYAGPEMIDQFIERAYRDPFRSSVTHPDLKEVSREVAEECQLSRGKPFLCSRWQSAGERGCLFESANHTPRVSTRVRIEPPGPVGATIPH